MVKGKGVVLSHEWVRLTSNWWNVSCSMFHSTGITKICPICFTVYTLTDWFFNLFAVARNIEIKAQLSFLWMHKVCLQSTNWQLIINISTFAKIVRSLLCFVNFSLIETGRKDDILEYPNLLWIHRPIDPANALALKNKKFIEKYVQWSQDAMKELETLNYWACIIYIQKVHLNLKTDCET